MIRTAIFFIPGIPEVGCFPADDGGGKAERGVVGFQIELQQQGGRGSGLADQGDVIAEGQVHEKPRNTGVKVAGAQERDFEEFA